MADAADGHPSIGCLPHRIPQGGAATYIHSQSQTDDMVHAVFDLLQVPPNALYPEQIGYLYSAYIYAGAYLCQILPPPAFGALEAIFQQALYHHQEQAPSTDVYGHYHMAINNSLSTPSTPNPALAVETISANFHAQRILMLGCRGRQNNHTKSRGRKALATENSQKQLAKRFPAAASLSVKENDEALFEGCVSVSPTLESDVSRAHTHLCGLDDFESSALHSISSPFASTPPSALPIPKRTNATDQTQHRNHARNSITGATLDITSFSLRDDATSPKNSFSEPTQVTQGTSEVFLSTSSPVQSPRGHARSTDSFAAPPRMGRNDAIQSGESLRAVRGLTTGSNAYNHAELTSGEALEVTSSPPIGNTEPTPFRQQRKPVRMPSLGSGPSAPANIVSAVNSSSEHPRPPVAHAGIRKYLEAYVGTRKEGNGQSTTMQESQPSGTQHRASQPFFPTGVPPPSDPWGFSSGPTESALICSPSLFLGEVYSYMIALRGYLAEVEMEVKSFGETSMSKSSIPGLLSTYNDLYLSLVSMMQSPSLPTPSAQQGMWGHPSTMMHFPPARTSPVIGSYPHQDPQIAHHHNHRSASRSPPPETAMQNHHHWNPSLPGAYHQTTTTAMPSLSGLTYNHPNMMSAYQGIYANNHCLSVHPVAATAPQMVPQRPAGQSFDHIQGGSIGDVSMPIFKHNAPTQLTSATTPPSSLPTPSAVIPPDTMHIRMGLITSMPPQLKECVERADRRCLYQRWPEILILGTPEVIGVAKTNLQELQFIRASHDLPACDYNERLLNVVYDTMANIAKGPPKVVSDLVAEVTSAMEETDFSKLNMTIPSGTQLIRQLKLLGIDVPHYALRCWVIRDEEREKESSTQLNGQAPNQTHGGFYGPYSAVEMTQLARGEYTQIENPPTIRDYTLVGVIEEFWDGDNESGSVGVGSSSSSLKSNNGPKVKLFPVHVWRDALDESIGCSAISEDNLFRYIPTKVPPKEALNRIHSWTSKLRSSGGLLMRSCSTSMTTPTRQIKRTNSTRQDSRPLPSTDGDAANSSSKETPSEASTERILPPETTTSVLSATSSLASESNVLRRKKKVIRCQIAGKLAAHAQRSANGIGATDTANKHGIGGSPSVSSAAASPVRAHGPSGTTPPASSSAAMSFWAKKRGLQQQAPTPGPVPSTSCMGD